MSPYHRIGSILRVSGSPTGVLQGHRVSYLLETEKFVDVLPIKPEDNPHKVILTGWYTSKQEASMLKHHNVSAENLRNILEVMYSYENPHYKDIKFSDDNLVACVDGAAKESFVCKSDYKRLNPSALRKNKKGCATGGINLLHKAANEESCVTTSTMALPEEDNTSDMILLIDTLKKMIAGEHNKASATGPTCNKSSTFTKPS